MEHDLLFFTDVAHPTWLLYVAILLVAVFFRFSRWVSVRNLDLLLLLSLSTALVFAATAQQDQSPTASQAETDSGTNEDTESKTAGAEQLADTSAASAEIGPDEEPAEEAGGIDLGESDGQIPWSSIVVLTLSIALIARLIFDEGLTRRPRLEQNLNLAGLAFLLLPAFSIVMAGVFVKPIPGRNLDTVESVNSLLERKETVSDSLKEETAPPAPTETIVATALTKVSELSGRVRVSDVQADKETTESEDFIARLLAAMAHCTVILGLLYIGRKHFCSSQLGISMSVLYLLLPCTAYNVHQVSHVVPAACLTWAVANYRRPAIAGVLLGMACGTLFFAVFLLPLWAVFYGRKGSIRFGFSLGAVAAVMFITFALTSENTDSFVNKLVMTANWSVFRLFDAAPLTESTIINQVFVRITFASIFFVMLVAMVVVPRKRNLENLLSNTAALIVTAQLWYPDDVATYVLWYLPLLLLVIFRPRLDRFVPPESPSSHRTRRTDEKHAPAGTMNQVTLYN